MGKKHLTKIKGKNTSWFFSKIIIPFSGYHGKIPTKMGKPMANDHYPNNKPILVSPGSDTLIYCR
jgi:hypothetical protein